MNESWLKSQNEMPLHFPKSTPFGQVEFVQSWSGTSTAAVGGGKSCGSSASTVPCVRPGRMSFGIHARRHTFGGAGGRSRSHSAGNVPLGRPRPCHSREYITIFNGVEPVLRRLTPRIRHWVTSQNENECSISRSPTLLTKTAPLPVILALTNWTGVRPA